MEFFKQLRPSYFGLMFIHIWIYCITHRSFDGHDVAIMPCLYIAQAAFLIIVLLVSLRHSLDNDIGHFADMTAAACMAAAAVLVCLPASIVSTPILITGLIAGGIGVTWAYIRWAQVYAKLDIRFAAPLIFLTMAFGSAIKALVDIASDDIALPMLALAPVAAFVTQLFAQRTIPDSPRPVPIYNPRTVSSLWPLFTGVAVYSLAVGIIQSVMLESTPPSSATSIWVHHGSEMLVGIAFFLWFIPLKRGLNFSRSWRLVVLLMTTALIFLPYIDESLLEYLLSLVRTAQTFLIIILFLTLADIARHSTYRASTVFSAGWFAYSLPFALGTIFGYELQVTTSATIIAAAIVWITVLAAMFLLDENTIGQSLIFSELTQQEFDDESKAARVSETQEHMESPEHARSLTDDTTARCRILARKSGLTSRETEILELLAHGRSKGYIADAFIISENTVRSHVKHLYTKLDVHNRQELLNLVEETPLGL